MTFLSNIFKSKPKLNPIDFSLFGVDIHSHLIPGIDDGSPDMEYTINLIRQFKEMGMNRVVTTPHVMCDYYKNTPDRIMAGLDAVRNELEKQHIQFEISAAAEYNLDDGLADLIKSKQILTFGDQHVLFELPFMNEPPNFQEIVFEFQMAGYKPILAHPERYSYWYNESDKYEELKAKGILLQLNLLSLTGHYSPQTKKIAEKMVDANFIDAVGTDCHRIEHLYILRDHLSLPHIHQLAKQENLLNKSL